MFNPELCCETMKQHLTIDCANHPNQTCPDQLIRKYKHNLGIPYGDGLSHSCIKFCPWCGKKIKGIK